jgi:hypothetical protein
MIRRFWKWWNAVGGASHLLHNTHLGITDGIEYIVQRAYLAGYRSGRRSK